MNPRYPQQPAATAQSRLNSDQSHSVVELEKKLREDETGALRDSLLKELAQYRAELKSVISAGVPSGVIKQLQALEHAYNQAEIVVQSYWMATHPQN